MSGVLDCCFRGYLVNPDASPGLRSPPPGIPVAAFFLLFSVVCGLLSFAMGPNALVFCCLLTGLITLCLGECLVKQHAALLPLLVLMGALTLFFAVFVGTLNWKANYHLYRVAEAGRTYKDVSPEARALPHSDAGIISFVGATVNTMNSMGLSDGNHIYCVVPIMTQQQSVVHGNAEQVPVQFWAVGMDCCERRGNFECDDVDLSSARGGIVVPQPDPGTWLGFFADILRTSSRWDQYAEVVEAAAAFHGLQAADPPVLLHWVEKPEDVKQGWHAASVNVFVFSSLIYLAFVSVAWMLVSYYFAQRIRRLVANDPDAPRPSGAPKSAMSAMRDPFLLGGPRSVPMSNPV